MSGRRQELSSSSAQMQNEFKQETSTMNVHQILWEINEPAFEQIEIKQEPILKIGTDEDQQENNISEDTAINSDSTVSQKRPDKCFKQVCNLLRLNHKLPLPTLKEELRTKKALSIQDYYEGNKEDQNCTSMFISHMPLWFKFFHVKAMIELLSDFDTNSSSYYIDMLKSPINKPTGKCLLRFKESKDCLQVYRDLYGLELDYKPISVCLDAGNQLSDERDRKNPTFEELLRKFNETRERHKQNYEPRIKVECDNVTMIKEEFQEDGQNQDVIQVDSSEEDLSSIKTEPLQGYTLENEQYQNIANENDNEISTIDVKDFEYGFKGWNGLTNADIFRKIERDLLSKGIEDIPVSHDYNNYYDTCRIVHIKNIPGSKLYESINIISDKIGTEAHFECCPVFNVITMEVTNILLNFPTHEDAESACKLLHGFTVLGQQIDASMGVGYQFKKKTSGTKLRSFEYKRMQLYSDSRENVEPATVDCTDDTYRSENYTTGFFPKVNQTLDTFFLLNQEFIRQIGVRVPFTSRVTVYHLHPDVDEKKLIEVFSLAGEVRSVCFEDTSESVQQANIEYDHPLEAIQAISMFNNHRLYNQRMKVSMDYSNHTKPLPLGLESIGQGLGTNGEPLRYVCVKAELFNVYEALADLKGMERVPLTKTSKRKITPAFKYSYKKLKPLKSLNVHAENKLSRRPDRNTKEKSIAQINYEALQNILTTIPSTQANPKPLAQTPKLTLAPNPNVNIIQQKNQSFSSTNPVISFSSTNPVISQTPIPEKANTASLDVAINRVLEFMTPKSVTLNMLQSNVAQTFPNPTHTPVQSITQPAMQLLTPNATNVMSTQPGYSQDKDFRYSRFLEGYRSISGNAVMYSNQQQERENKDKCEKTDVTETTQSNPSSERDPWKERGSIEKSDRERKIRKEDYRSRREKSEKDRSRDRSRDRRGSIGKDSRRRRHSRDKDSPNRGSKERDKRHTYSEERSSRRRRRRSSEEYRHRDSSDELSKYSRHDKEKDYRHKRRKLDGSSGSSNDGRDSRSCDERDDQSAASKVSKLLVFDNLPPSVSVASLQKKMGEVGPVDMCESTSSGRAFLRFTRPQDADTCIRLFNNSKVDKQIIQVRYL